jgi:ADP-ribosylglycohydrolase
MTGRDPLLEQAPRIYAGVLGKIFGVYLGRPVEGWTYERIGDEFGHIDYYVNERLGLPLIVPDDDISGTFVFFRALEDNPPPAPLDAATVGDAWLNYIVENKTVLWFGGLARSTEHTAFLRLGAGIPAPRSGSLALNGPAMAEQIGAEIFIDAWAMANPGDPERAVAMARAAASVSHDALAVDAAAFVAAMEAHAFIERDLETLMDQGLELVASSRLTRLVDDVRQRCRDLGDWREVRDWIEVDHGYDRYPSNSPIQTNHAAVIMALLFGGDSWQRSVGICTTAGWDTDSNTGNVGALNGIRLGLEGFDLGADFRGPIADRFYAVSADGGECVTDAVQQTRRIIQASAAARGRSVDLPTTRYAFELPGSVQGFRLHPGVGLRQAALGVTNAGRGLAIEYRALAHGTVASVSVDTSAEPRPRARAGTSDFEVVGSPALYPTQTVVAELEAGGSGPRAALFIDSFGDDGVIETIAAEPRRLGAGTTTLRWEVPDVGGRTIHRVGIALTSDVRIDGQVVLRSMDWAGAPRDFSLARSYDMTPGLDPWTTDTAWLRSFVSSAQNLAPDYTTTFCVSHPRAGGVVTTGTRDWVDYRVSSRIQFNASEAGGLVARARGHRRYYAAVVVGSTVQIIKQRDGERTVLAEAAVQHETDQTHDLAFEVDGTALVAYFDGVPVCTAQDPTHVSGGAGFLVDCGAMLADGFRVQSI